MPRKYHNIHNNIYVYDIQIHTSFPSSSDTDLIDISMFNCITELTQRLSCKYISLTITKTDTSIF